MAVTHFLSHEQAFFVIQSNLVESKDKDGMRSELPRSIAEKVRDIFSLERERIIDAMKYREY